MSEEKKYVEYGDRLACAIGDKNLTGVRFQISPMSDHYVEIILDSIARVDMSKIWSETDELSTVYRGKRIHVMDALKGCFVQSYREKVHMVMEATISKGCPGDRLADYYMAEDDVRMNEPLVKDVHFPVAVKFALYPMGIGDYMKDIAYVVNKAIDLGIYDRSSHYATILKGDVQDIFAYFDDISAYCEEHISHYIIEATFAVNLPEEQ